MKPFSIGALQVEQPLGLLSLLLAVPIVLLYILKIQRRKQSVSSLFLWRSAERDLLAKTPFRKLLPEASLLLQLLLLFLFTLACASPSFPGSGFASKHVALVIDTSASMGAKRKHKEGQSSEQTRFALGIEKALKLVDELPFGAEMMLIDAGSDAHLLLPFDADKLRIKKTLKELTFHEVEGDLNPSLSMASARLRDTQDTEALLVLVSDGAFARPPTLPAGVSFRMIDVGEAEAENVSLVRMDSAYQKDRFQVFSVLKSFFKEPKEVFVRLHVEGQKSSVDSRRVTLLPGEELPVTLSFEPRRQDERNVFWVEVESVREEELDVFSYDNLAYGVLPSEKKLQVVHVSNEPKSWLMRALAVDESLMLQSLTPNDLKDVAIEPESLVFLEGYCPSSVPGQDVVVFAPPPGTSCFGVDASENVQNARITSWKQNDARLRFINLDEIQIGTFTPFRAASPKAELARTTEGIMMVDASTGIRNVTLVGFSPSNTDWPLKASFVLFVRNLTELSKEHRLGAKESSVMTGTPLLLHVPEGVSLAQFREKRINLETSLTEYSPPLELPVRAHAVSLPAASRRGVYELSWKEPHLGFLRIATNLFSVSECDIGKHEFSLTKEEPAQVVSEGGKAGSFGSAITTIKASRKSLLPFLVPFLLLVLFADLYVYAWHPASRLRKSRTKEVQKGFRS